MKPKYKKTITKYCNKENWDGLASFLAEKIKQMKIQVDELINGITSKEIEIHPKCLNKTACKLNRKTHALAKFNLVKKAAEMGLSAAQRNLAFYYFQAIGTKKNIKLAKAWCLKAIPNYPKAKLLLAAIYIDQGDFIKAHKVLNDIKSNSKDYQDAQSKMSECLHLQLADDFKKIPYDDEDKDQKDSDHSSSEEGSTVADANINAAASDEIAEDVSDSETGNKQLSPQVKLFDVYWVSEDDQQIIQEYHELQKCIASIEEEIELLDDSVDDANIIDNPQMAFEYRYAELTRRLEELNEQKKRLKPDYNKAIQKRAYAREKELQRQYRVHQRFFDPSRTKAHETYQLAKEIQHNRIVTDGTQTRLLKIDDISVRRVITAEAATVHASLKFRKGSSLRQGKRNVLGWFKNRQEAIALGGAQVKYKQSPSEYDSHPGNYMITNSINGGNPSFRYEDVISFFNKLTQCALGKEKQLAELLLSYPKNGQAITKQAIQSFYQDVSDQDVIDINVIAYHVFVKENSRWIGSEKKFDVPATIVQVRAIRLVAWGKLTLAQVFSEDARYGVMTGTGIYFSIDNGKWRKKANRINRLYNQTKRQQFVSGSAPFFVSELFKEPRTQWVTTAQSLRKELSEIYGGDSDTDGEGYDSEQEDSYFTHNDLYDSAKDNLDNKNYKKAIKLFREYIAVCEYRLKTTIQEDQKNSIENQLASARAHLRTAYQKLHDNVPAAQAYEQSDAEVPRTGVRLS